MTVISCEAHRYHAPRALTVELHHVIPVAWQLEFEPKEGAFLQRGRDHAGRGMLWDTRTVVLCPTGHRNVHAVLTDLVRVEHTVLARHGGRREAVIARQALTRMFGATGITAAELYAARLYGNA